MAVNTSLLMRISPSSLASFIIGAPSFPSGDLRFWNSLKEILLSLESFEVVNERVPATFESIKIIDNTIHIKSKLGITLVVRMGTNISAKLQCDGIYNVFYTMNGDDRQLPNYLYMNNNGDISNSAKLEFDK